MSTHPNPGRGKAVCNGCRARKKKCDGEQPACSSCRKRNAKCSYVNIPASMLVSSPWAAMDLSPFVFSIPAPGASESLPLAAPDDTLFQTFVGPDLGSTPVAVTDPWDTLLFDSISPLPLSPPGSEGPHSDQAPLQSGPEPENPNLDWIPSDDTAAEIVGLFFERVQWYFPLFHHKSLIASVKTGELRKSCPLLLYSIMAVAARGHPNPSIRAAHVTFHKKSQALYEVTTHVPDRPLETLQAACCIVLQAFILGDHSNAAFVLSKAWRQTVALGFHHLDTSSRVVLPGITAPDTSEWRESEQRRRALWALFVMDRAMCFKAGLVHTIDDRQISVFLPMREDAFQNSETPPDLSDAVLYPHNSKMLIGALQNLVCKTRHGMMQFIILAHSLMGRISEHMFSPVFGQDDPQHELEKAHLDQDLGQMRLILPRSATDLAAASHEDFGQVVWLRITMDVNTVSLYHRPQQNPGTVPSDYPNDEECDSTRLLEEGRWQHCVVAARNTVLSIREVSRVSTDLMMNPYLAASIFTCARVLAIEYILSSPTSDTSNTDQEAQRRQELREDLEIMVLIFERLCETFGGVLEKFRVGLLYQLRLDAASVRAVKAGGTRGLLESCGKWPMARDIEGLEGIPD